VAIASAFVLLASFAALPAFAVHDTGFFELDGNATNDPAVAGDDWDNVCHQVTIGAECASASNTSGATAVSWVSEPNRATSIFTGGGSKDPQDISNWAWKDAGGLPDKDNLRHSFAARYSGPPSADCPAGTALTCEVLYFGSDRFDNSGDAQQGFWFFQNKITLGSTPSGGGFNFNGVHKNGDLLIISDFSNGGTVSTISIYKWNSAVSGNLQLLASSDAANCGTAAPHDQFCGLVNANTITLPWAFTDKSGTPNNQALNGEFYEGGVNLSTLGLGSECFASVASETRSSTSTTATLKDFVLGNFGECGSKTETTPKDSGGNDIPADGLTIPTTASGNSLQVKDSATVTVTGSGSVKASGSVSFFLCGPTPLSDASYTLCTTGGASIGTVNLSGNNNPDTVSSALATLTSAGRYCWRAVYSGDEAKGIPGSSDSRVSECFKVNPVQPALDTQADQSSVTLGNPISDTASLTGTASQPGTNGKTGTGTNGSIDATNGAVAGGTITFTLLGPGNCSTVAFTSSAKTVTGDGNYGSGNFTPLTAGTYHWVASYSGDSPNTLATNHNTSCDDTDEDVVVISLQPTMDTNQRFVPNDSATVSVASGGGNLAGTVRFRLYDNSTCSPAGTTLYDKTFNIVTDGTGTGLVRTVSTDNTTAYTVSKSFSWLVEYVSTNGAHTNVTSVCNNEHSSITIDNGTQSNS
jgi:hypothetical protein